MWEKVLVSYQSLYMYLLTQTGDSIKILNRVVTVYIFSALTLIIIYIYSYHLPSSFFKSNILSLMPIKSLLLFSAMSFPTLLQP